MGCLVWLMGLVYRQRRSVAVADVPVGGLDHLALAVADLLTDLLLADHLGGVLCHHGGEQLFVGHLGFVHADSMAGNDGVWGVEWTVRQLSQDLQVVKDDPILPNLGVDELVCFDGEQALRLCPGLAVDGFPGVRGDEDGVAGLIEVVHAVILQGHGLVGLQAVPVHPLSQAGGGVPRCCQDGTTGDASEAIGLPAAGELYPSGARDRIDGQTVNSG